MLWRLWQNERPDQLRPLILVMLILCFVTAAVEIIQNVLKRQKQKHKTKIKLAADRSSRCASVFPMRLNFTASGEVIPINADLRRAIPDVCADTLPGRFSTADRIRPHRNHAR